MVAEQAVTASADAEGSPDRAALPLSIKQGVALRPDFYYVSMLISCYIIYSINPHRAFSFNPAYFYIFASLSGGILFVAFLAKAVQLKNHHSTQLTVSGVSRNFGFTGTIPWTFIDTCALYRFGRLQRLRFHILPSAFDHTNLRRWTFFPSSRARDGHFDVCFERKFPKDVADAIAVLCTANITEARWGQAAKLPHQDMQAIAGGVL